MPVRLHHIVIDAHDLPGLARFWTQALGWKLLSEHEREIVIGADEKAPVGICFMPVTEGSWNEATTGSCRRLPRSRGAAGGPNSRDSCSRSLGHLVCVVRSGPMYDERRTVIREQVDRIVVGPAKPGGWHATMHNVGITCRED